MKIKVCGMKYPQNISEIAALQPDYMGFIFYEKSPRYVLSDPNFQLSTLNFQLTKKVGVFVNAGIDYIMETITKYNFDFVQLHGTETVEFCKELSKTVPVIKAFNISKVSDFEQTKLYGNVCNYFLFDTKTDLSPNPSPQERGVYGGSGQKFDWDILNAYKGDTLFFLSGGISPDDTDRIKEIQHPKLHGVDLNSRFETEPGLKNIGLIELFIKQINTQI